MNSLQMEVDYKRNQSIKKCRDQNHTLQNFGLRKHAIDRMTEASELHEEVPEQNISLTHVLINMYILRMLLSCTSINPLAPEFPFKF